MLNEVLKKLYKMISADLKADIKQQEIQELVVVSFIFYRSTFKT